MESPRAIILTVDWRSVKAFAAAATKIVHDNTATTVEAKIDRMFVCQRFLCESVICKAVPSYTSCTAHIRRLLHR